MPKIINNVEGIIAEVTKRQLMENGYKNTTIRSIASECNIGVGTLYNHYKSKDYIISSFMLDDWKICIQKLENAKNNYTENKLDNPGFFKEMYLALKEFNDKYRFLFDDKDAKAVFSQVISDKHNIIIETLSRIVLPVCLNSSISEKEFLAMHLANTILNWSVKDVPFETGAEIIQKLLK